MDDKHARTWVMEDEPPATRPRWFCHDRSFDTADEAVGWALTWARSVIVRTLEPRFFFAGERPESNEHESLLCPWPPSAEQRREIERTYARAALAEAELNREFEEYEKARDAWLGEFYPDLVGPPLHACSVLESRDDWHPIELEEFDQTAAVCGARRGAVHAFGPVGSVIAALANPSVTSDWVERVCVALERDRRAAHRKGRLLTRLGAGEHFHVTASVNRESILAHGLDWRLMTVPGIAGSRGPEAEGIFLVPTVQDTEFFVSMARSTVDVWSVRVDDLWLENDPNGGELWMIVPEVVSADRLKLIQADIPQQRANPAQL